MIRTTKRPKDNDCDDRRSVEGRHSDPQSTDGHIPDRAPVVRRLTERPEPEAGGGDGHCPTATAGHQTRAGRRTEPEHHCK